MVKYDFKGAGKALDDYIKYDLGLSGFSSKAAYGTENLKAMENLDKAINTLEKIVREVKESVLDDYIEIVKEWKEFKGELSDRSNFISAINNITSFANKEQEGNSRKYLRKKLSDFSKKIEKLVKSGIDSDFVIEKPFSLEVENEKLSSTTQEYGLNNNHKSNLNEFMQCLSDYQISFSNGNVMGRDGGI